MAKRDIDQPEAQRGEREREMNDIGDENAGRSDDVRGIADEEEDDFEEDDDADDLEEEDTENM
jgi:hypothetical protein